MLSMMSLCLSAQESGAPEPKKDDAKTGATECEPKRSMSPDGTLVVRNRDCSITKVSKDQMLKPLAEDAAAPQAKPDKNPQAAKLREMKPQELPPGEEDPKLRAKYLEAMNGYFDYYAAGYLHRQRVFEWQLISSKIIFILVTLLVCSGVYFAALQFHEGMRRRAVESARIVKSTTGDGEAPAAHVEDTQVTTFSASVKGIEVSSPVLGVVILVISLAFFYLYLVYVYPITELF
jgi:hypothetical protein